MNSAVISAVKFAMPHGLVQRIFRSQALRRRMLAEQNAAHASVVRKVTAYSYAAAIAFQRARGLPEGYLMAGSIPESALKFCADALDEFAPGGRPLIGLHIGNFLGISLSYFTDYVRRRHEKSTIISIDPNIQHQGVENPQNHVMAILNQFGLQKNAVVCAGYSMNKTVSNDGFVLVGQDGTEYDPYSKFESENSCEGVLSNLCLLSGAGFDFAVVDGNHEGEHLSREIAAVRRLLRPGGLLILDDVSDAYADIVAEYAALGAKGWRQVRADGRVGILQEV
jgi:Methyltransferase domain